MNEDWNRPSRTDHYLMQIAATQSTKKLNLNQLKLKFSNPIVQDLTKLSKEELDEMSAQVAAVWRTRLGIRSPETRQKLARVRQQKTSPMPLAAEQDIRGEPL